MTADDRPIVAAISGGSQEAFVMLFDLTSDAVRCELASRLPDEEQAIVVFAATYVEVWWLAGCHDGSEIDAVEWIRQILNRRIADVSVRAGRASVPAGNPWPSYVEDELESLLGRPVERRWRPDRLPGAGA